VVARISLLVIAVLALAWLGVLLRDQNVGQAASQRLAHNPRLAPAEVAREMKRLEDAELLNPDSSWQLSRGKHWLARKRPRRAVRVVESLLRSEPDNIDGWFIVYVATRPSDPRRAARARAEIKRLNPLILR
jgi:predicted Zn-dependent protease